MLTRTSSPEASWHSDYRDTAYIYVGGLPFELSEGDIITIFSQYGEPTFVNLVRDKETGKSKGFAFIKYEDQRSTDLAVDNLGGTKIMNRVLRVDHTRYKKKDDDPEESPKLDDKHANSKSISYDKESKSEGDTERPMLKEERELLSLIEEHDDDDPMKAYLIREKKDEVAATMKGSRDTKRSSKDGRSRRHHRSHRSSRSHSPGEKPRHSRQHDDKGSSRYNDHTDRKARREDPYVRREHRSTHEG